MRPEAGTDGATNTTAATPGTRPEPCRRIRKPHEWLDEVVASPIVDESLLGAKFLVSSSDSPLANRD
jgi:hypothetical protein